MKIRSIAIKLVEMLSNDSVAAARKKKVGIGRYRYISTHGLLTNIASNVNKDLNSERQPILTVQQLLVTIVRFVLSGSTLLIRQH